MNTHTTYRTGLMPFLFFALTLFLFSLFPAASNAAPVKAIVSPQELTALLDANRATVLDVRPGIAYAAGHIPGAIQVYKDDYYAPSATNEFTLASYAQLQRLIQQLGITKETHVVLYDNNMYRDAAQLWWILDFFGYTNTSLLDGGFAAWNAARLPLSTTPAFPTANAALPPAPNVKTLISAQELLQELKDQKNSIILDVRRQEEYDGSELIAGATHKGHIPHAINIPWSAIIDRTTQKLLPPEEIKTIYASKGITPETPLIIYCHKGLLSNFSFFICKRIVGVQHIRVYRGGWAEWTTDLHYPAAQPGYTPPLE